MFRFDTNNLKLAVIFIGTNNAAKDQFFSRYFDGAYIRILLSQLITRQREHAALRQCFKHGDSFVIDNDNLTEKDRARYIPEAKEAGYRIIGYYFNFDDRIEEKLADPLLNRDLLRAYNKMNTKAEFPEYSEGFDEIYSVTLQRSGEFKIEKI